MEKVILDTNALMAIAEFKLDVFSALKDCCDFPFQVYVLSGTMDELEKIKEKQRGGNSRAAKLALSLLKFKKIKVIKEKGLVDDLLVQHSKTDLVLTQDIGLKRRLKKPYLTIRQKRKVVIIN